MGTYLIIAILIIFYSWLSALLSNTSGARAAAAVDAGS